MDTLQTNTANQPTGTPFDAVLRPSRLRDYVGQPDIKKNVDLTMTAAKGRGEPMEHVLLAGPPGLGKTTLARIIAHEMESPFRVTSGPALERSGDLASILASLQPGEVLFIDEIHRLNHSIEEMLYPVMEDWSLDIVLGKGPAARTMRLDIAPFTLVGATTRPGDLSAPLRDRFGLHYHLNYYSTKEMETIVRRSAQLLGVAIDNAAIRELACRSRATPRVANRLVKRVRDFGQVHHPGITLTNLHVKASLGDLGIDEIGLDQIDRKLLQAIAHQFGGGPVGAQTLATATSLERATLEDVYEPYLMQIGFLERTPRGRKITTAGRAHVGVL